MRCNLTKQYDLIKIKRNTLEVMIMVPENKALSEAYSLLEKATPLGRIDCGDICGCACCTDKAGDSMELFPHESELFLNSDDFIIIPGEVDLIKCSTKCDRCDRPLSCRLFPLFPLVQKKENGAYEVNVIIDPRAERICPLSKCDINCFDRSFVRAVRRAGLYLVHDKECAAYLEGLSDVLCDYIDLKDALIK